MATIVAMDCTDGALLAGDRVVVREGTEVGSRRHVFGFDGTGAAAVGDDVDSFRRQFDVAIRAFAEERGEPGVDAVTRMAGDIVGETGVQAFIAVRGYGGRATVRSVDEATLEARVAAKGSGAAVVLGQLEHLDETTLDEAATVVESAFSAAAERDPGTGEAVDSWRLPDADAGKTL